MTDPLGSPSVPRITQRSHHVTNQKVIDLVATGDWSRRRILDVGAGEGYLVSRLGALLQERFSVAPAEVLRACDTHPEAYKYTPVPCDRIEPGGRLPYEAEAFEVVTCVEVIEHLEDQFHLAREIFRVLKPGGRALVTTPNALNINSRLRAVHSGFATLFDLLPLHRTDSVHLAGHIHPISFYYLAHLFRRAGFREVRAHFDFSKRSAILFTLLLYLPLQLWHLGFRHHMKSKYGAIYAENQPLLEPINSWGMLTSRSVIVEAIK